MPLAGQRLHVGRVVVALVVLGSLTLPVEYRGGSEVAHAHAGFQLWFDLARGSTVHHHAATDHRHGAGERHAGLGAHPSHPAPHDHEPRPVPSARDEEPDVPRLSALASSPERVAVVALAALVGSLVVPAGRRIAVPRSAGRWAGVTHAPDPPPPRLRATS